MKPVSSLVKVFAREDLTAIDEETKGSCLLNERYDFQVCVRGSENLEGLSLEIAGVNGTYTVYSVREIKAGFESFSGGDEYMLHSEDKMYPELLEEFEEGSAFSLEEGKTSVFWVSLSALEQGVSKIKVSVLKGNERLCSCEYQLNVIGLELPEMEGPITTWMHYDCIAHKCGYKPFTPEYYEVFGEYLKAFVDGGMNMLLIPTFTPALDTGVGAERMTAQLVKVFLTNGEYSFDFSNLAYFLDFVTEKGVKYYEFAHLFTQWGAEFCPKIYVTVDGEEKKLFGWHVSSESEEYKAFLSAYLPALCDFLKARGIADKSFIHLSDEPHQDHLERYKRLYDFVKSLIGDIKTLDALSEYSFYQKGAVDLPVVLTSMARPFVDNNVTHLAYYCCGPWNYSASNRFFAMPAERTRVIGTQMYQNDAIGFLHWGYNFYNTQYSVREVDPYVETDAGGKFPSGDSYIVYPTKTGVKKSIRYFLLAAGFSDYRALKLLESYIGKEKTQALLRKFGVYGYHAYPHSPYLFKMMREVVNRSLERFAKK